MTADALPFTALARVGWLEGHLYGMLAVGEDAQLIGAGLLDATAHLTSANGVWPAEVQVLPNGSIKLGGTEHPSPSAAACAVKGGAANGWDFWAITTPNGLVRLSSLRKRYLDAQQAT